MPGFVSSAERHPNRNAIISRLLAGDTLKSIAADFQLSIGILSRFKQKIVRPAVFGSQPINNQEIMNTVRGMREGTKQKASALIIGASTADLVAQKLGRYNRILEKAEKAGELGNWASIDRAETAALQLQAQLRGEVNQVHSQTTVQMVVYTPNVEQDQEVTEVEVIEDAGAVEEIAAPEAPDTAEPPPPADPVAEVLARLPKPKPKKPPKPPSTFKQLQKLSAKDRKAAIRLIGQGLDPFAAAPDLPE